VPLALTVLPRVSVPPVAVKEILPFDPVLIAPLVVNAPVFVTMISPAVSLIPFTVKAAAVFVREIPPPASVALKLVTVLALPKLVPVPETVVSNAPLRLLVLISLIAPVVAVRETLPAVLILPPSRVTLPLAAALTLPDTAVTLPFTQILLLVSGVAVVVMLIVLVVPVVCVVPFSRISPLPTLPVREILPAACRELPFSTSIAVLAAPPLAIVSVMVEPEIVRLALEVTEPALVTRTPPAPTLVSSAYNPKLEPEPLVLNAPVTIMLPTTEKLVALVKFNVPKVRFSPLPCRVISPAPTTGDAFRLTPPPTVNTPPVPVPVFNTPLSTKAVTSFGFAVVAEIEPPFVFTPALIVKTRAKLSGVRVLRLTLPPVVLIAPEIVIAPVLVILTLPLPLLCAIPVTINVPVELFVKSISPLVALVALKPVTVLALFNVVPPTELVVRNAPLIRAEPLSAIAPLDVSDTLLALPAATLPIMLIAPLLLIETFPVPASLIPATVKSAAVFASDIPPFASVALKLVTVLALFKVVPVSETVASNPPLIKFVLISLIAPAAAVRETLPPVLILPPFKVTLSPAVAEIAPEVLATFAPIRILLLAPVALSMTLPEPLALTVLPMVSVPPVAVNEILPFNPVLIAPPVLNAPLFVTLISPVPVSLIPVTNKGAAVFVREIPPPASVALKLVTVLALPKLVPAPEFVVSNAPLIVFVLISLSAPAVAVRETLPLVLILPPFRVRLSPAVAVITPEVLLIFAPTRMLLAAPVAVSVTVPEPPAVTVLPSVSVPPVAVNEMVPESVLIVPLVVNAPVLATTTLPPPVSLIPVIVNGAAVFVN
jgi:hypothetical protein